MSQIELSPDNDPGRHQKPVDAKHTRIRPWLRAILFALVPVAFTAAGSAVAQILSFSDAASALVIACAALLSGLVALAVMLHSRPTISDYGLRRPIRLRAAMWFLPALATVAIVIITQASGVDAAGWLPYGALVVAAALNEEFWFRGVILTVLRTRGTTPAIYGSAMLFAILHLANLAGGESPADAVLQLVFALVFGIASAQVVILTGSVWPVIAWHAAWDFVNFLSGNETTPSTLIGIALAAAITIVYALILGRRLSRMEATIEREQSSPA